IAPHIEEPRTAWPSQVLTSCCREQITADRLDIDGDLPDRLAGIQKIEDIGLSCNLADLSSRVNQSTVGGYVGDRDQLDALIDQVLKSLHRYLPILVIGHHLNYCACPLGDLQEGNVVA